MEQRPSVGFGEYVRLTATSWVSSVTGALLHRLSADLGRFIESPFGVGWSHGVQTNMSEWDGCGSAARLASSGVCCGRADGRHRQPAAGVLIYRWNVPGGPVPGCGCCDRGTAGTITPTDPADGDVEGLKVSAREAAMLASRESSLTWLVR
jgi:hypothetical protein